MSDAFYQPDQASAPPQVPTRPDFEKIDRNMKRLVQQKAPDEDISSYLSAEGVTAEQVLQYKPGLLARAGSAIAGAASAVAGMVRGEQDPKFADVPGFSGEGLGPTELSAIKRGRIVTFDDAAYGDVVRKALGPKLVKTEKDAAGYEVVTYRDDGGQERRAYVNKPGLDLDDVSRTVESSVPFLMTGGVAGTLMKGMPLLARLVGQGVTAGATSIGADMAAKPAGSKQGVDLPRAGFAAAGGAVGEALSPLVVSTWRRLVTKPGMVDDAGRLSAAGRAEAAKFGLSADEIAALETGGKSEAFAGAASYARDPAEVAAAVRTGEFGIPTTKGQRTGDPRLVQMEQEMRKGLWGDQAKRIVDEFDKSQSAAISGAVTDQIGKSIAPTAAGIEKATTGRGVQDGLRTARAYMDEAENQLWGAAGPMFPREEGFDLLAGRVARSLQDSNIWPKPNLGAYKSSNEMLQFLEDYTKGKVLEQEIPLVGKGRSSIFLDDARRYLLNLYRGAEPRTADAKAAKAIYDGFNTWIDDLADNALLVGDAGAAGALKTARAFTKDMKQLIGPRDVTGKLTPAGRRLEQVFDRADSPESVIDALVPQPSTKLRVGDVETLKHAKDIMVNNGAPDAWDDLRLAYWVKIAQNDKGQIHSPKLLKNRIDAAFTNQKTALDVMFTPDEQGLMKRFAGALDEATWVDPNPSGTSYALESMRRRFEGGSAIKTLLQTQSKRELFSKHNVLASRIYQILARKMPVSVFGSKEGAGAAAASRSIGQDLTATRPPSFGGIGAAAGAQAEE